MGKKKTEKVYYSHVDEIMGPLPGKILRWGTTVVFSVFIMIFFLAWLIKYPDAIPSTIEITTVNPPVTLVSKISGRIKRLYVRDREQVDSGRLLAVMETAASIEEVSRLKQTIDTITRPESLDMARLPGFTELGEIQEYWSSFVKCLSDYSSYLANDYYGNKIASLTDEINSINGYIGNIRVKESLYSENQRLEEKQYRRDSTLYITGVYSESDLEKARQSLLRINIELQQVRLDHSEKSIELAEKKQLLQDYRIMRQEEKEKYYSLLNQSFLNLKAQLRIWENNYLIVSPVSGLVTFTRYWSENQSVTTGDPVMSIVPLDAGDYVGRISLKMSRSGKVKEGQTVNIKLSGYPYLEYGMVKGIVKSKSLVPSGDSYIIEVSLPDGLTTLYGKKLEFTQNMEGIAEIITDNLNLLQKVINPFRYLISRNRQ